MLFSWDSSGQEARTGTNFWVVNAKRILWTGRWRERREYCSPANVKSIKEKCAYNYCICDVYVPILSICNQLIPIDICYLSIDCYWKSIPIDNHMNLRQWLVIDCQTIGIDWYRLSSVIDFIDWIAREYSRTSITRTRITLACLASVSNRVIARKLEREQKKGYSFCFLLLSQLSGRTSRGNACYAG